MSGSVPNSGDDMDVDPSGSTIPMDIDSSGSHIPSLSSIPNLDEYRRFVYQEADPLRRSERKKTTPRRYAIDSEANMSHVLSALTQVENIPVTLDDIMNSPNKEEWIKAMENEMNSMRKYQVWELVDLHESRKPIRNK